MCGIIGFTGKSAALPVLLHGLSVLEYRGYDSAGVALHANGIVAVKTKGRIAALTEKLAQHKELEGACCGIGHTRWATHGAPADRNAHPHTAAHLALVHNGIIENYTEIAAFLRERGYTFASDTDTETAAMLIDWFYRETGDPQRAIFAATEKLRGSYAFGILFDAFPDRIYAIRKDSPLIVAVTAECGLIASDVPAILSHSKDYYRPADGVLCVLEPSRVRFFLQSGEEVAEQTEHVDWSVDQAQKGGWPHFMLKEIHEAPEAIRRTVSHYVKDGLPHFSLPLLDGEELSRFEGIHMVACGTAMHAGLIGQYVIEKLARVPVFVETAGEFRYRDPILSPKDLVVLLSQSGETADTLAALRHAKAKGVRTLAIVNVVGSSVAREADAVIYTPAGPEIAVASTKAYSVQCAVLYLIAARLAMLKGRMSQAEVTELCLGLWQQVPHAVEQVLGDSDRIRVCARELIDAEHLFYIGRGVDSALCTEGSLKLKEISYIHSEAYAAGELKHGTISLITKGTPVIALMTASHLGEKMLTGVREIRSRGARVLLVISTQLSQRLEVPADDRIILPEIPEILAPFVGVTALQLLAYHVAALKGLDVDKPRNLAKSVTVE